MAQSHETSQVTQTLAPKMGLPLFIPPSSCSTSVQHHPYPNRSLRIHVEGPAIAIERLFPHIWNVEGGKRTYSQRVSPELAQLTFRTLYGREMRPDIPGDMIIRNEYLGWMAQNSPGETREIGYYGVTFDHFVPEYDVRPDVFQLNLVEIENDGVLTPTHAYGVLLTRQNTLGRRCLLCHAVVKTGDYYKMTGD